MIRRIQMKFTRSALLSATFLLTLGTAQAYAYCVYNNTQQSFHVVGESCSRCMKTWVEPGGRACCPGNNKGCRGSTWINVSVPSKPWDSGGRHYKHAEAEVTAHGWVKIYGGSTHLRGEVYDDNGNILWQGTLDDGKIDQ
jgi:hypothetical protein